MDTTADVCLVLEGTYPYTRGGLSVWTHQLISSMPDLTFHLWCVVPKRHDERPLYVLPPNVVGTTQVPLVEPVQPAAGAMPPALWQGLRELHRDWRQQDRAARWATVETLLDRFGSAFQGPEVLLCREGFDLIVEQYQRRGLDLPFVDYYYSVLSMHLPLFKLLTAPIPPARLIHTTCTGYAGLLACRARRRLSVPLILTEHGIYTNERHIEITLADWIGVHGASPAGIVHPIPTLQDVWIQMFDLLGRVVYEEADVITTLFEGNRAKQVEYGADPAKTRLIPNGVDLPHLTALPRRTDPARPTVGLIGRVVPIKDVQVFIKACRVVADKLPGARFLVMGATAQDPAYYRKCLQFRKLLGLEDRLTFTDDVPLDEYYPQLDAVALTSISEAQPLVLLEAMACGIPTVATRVGACEELTLGLDEQDRALGPSGILTSVGDYEAVGRGLLAVLEDRELARRISEAGRERVRRRYDLTRVLAQYRDLYREFHDRRKVA